MPTIKLTSKRQATFPAALLKHLGLQPGDEIDLKFKSFGKEKVWVLQPKSSSLSWYGSLKKYARNKDYKARDFRDKAGKAIAEHYT